MAVRARHRLEDTVLHKVVRENLERFLRLVREETGKRLPRFIERAFRAYLGCGIPAVGGFTRVVCPSCKTGEIIALSCKTRSLCPSCSSRHMADGGAHLVDHVLPAVPFLHVVISPPFELRALLSFRPDVMNAVVRLCSDTLSTWQRGRSVDVKALVASLCVVQRGGNGLNLHPHLHIVLAAPMDNVAATTCGLRSASRPPGLRLPTPTTLAKAGHRLSRHG